MKYWLLASGLFVSLLVPLAVAGCGKASPTVTTSRTTAVSPAAYSATVVVQPGDALALPFLASNLNRVEGSITVQATDSDGIDFSIRDPYGNQVLPVARVSQSRSFSFIATTTGDYSLYLDNSFSLLSSKTVKHDFAVSAQ
jgi:hypothetical protein